MASRKAVTKAVTPEHGHSTDQHSDGMEDDEVNKPGPEVERNSNVEPRKKQCMCYIFIVNARSLSLARVSSSGYF